MKRIEPRIQAVAVVWVRMRTCVASIKLPVTA